jgi:hypothetical protein
MKLITKSQSDKISKIFFKKGITFQAAARIAGLKNIPDHLNELTKDEADKFLKYFKDCFK